MLNFRPFRARSPQRGLSEECAFRKRAGEQWQESVSAYYEAVQMLAQRQDYEAVYESAETLRLLSQEIKQILEDHEREHGCGDSEETINQPTVPSGGKVRVNSKVTDTTNTYSHAASGAAPLT
jgi:hypothetical protein